MNVLTYNISCIHRRLGIVLEKILNIYSDFTKNSRIQANRLINKMITKANDENIPQSIRCNCGWGEIYSNRYGIHGFPCLNNVLGKKYDFQNLLLPNIDTPQVHSVRILQKIEKWDFSRKTKNEFEFTLFEKNELEFEFYVKEKSINNFILQTAKEIFNTSSCISNKFEDVLMIISIAWGSETKSLPNEIIENMEFRSNFRFNIYKMLVKSKN